MKTKAHEKAQKKAAGKKGRTEVKTKSGKFLDAVTASGNKITRD